MKSKCAPDSLAEPTHDEILSTPRYRLDMKFRVRLFHVHPLTVVLLTELADNPGCSITNGIEDARRAVLHRWPELNPARLVLVEHYDSSSYPPSRRRETIEESFDLVTFSPEDLQPRWQRISKRSLEALLGAKLP